MIGKKTRNKKDLVHLELCRVYIANVVMSKRAEELRTTVLKLRKQIFLFEVINFPPPHFHSFIQVKILTTSTPEKA